MLKIAVLGALLFVSSARADNLGNDVGGGGDGIYCTRSGYNPLNGFYMLDYVLMRDPGFGERRWPISPDFDSMHDYHEVLNWIQTHLDQKLPRLGPHFREYRASLFVDNQGAKRIWKPFPYLDRLYDQGLDRQWFEQPNEIAFPSMRLPGNSRAEDILQLAILFKKEDGSYLYAYVPDLVKRLATQSPVQVSFLIVHEWLRDFTNDAIVIRRVNRILHTTAMDEKTPGQLRRLLRSIGFVPPWWMD
jgi:hypothetical protein